MITKWLNDIDNLIDSCFITSQIWFPESALHVSELLLDLLQVQYAYLNRFSVF